MTDWSKRDRLTDDERAYITNNLPGGKGEVDEHDRYWAGEMDDTELASMRGEGGESGLTESDDDYEDWTNNELREELGNRGLGAQGNKTELINRLRLNDRENAASQA